MESIEATTSEYSAGAVANILFDALRRGDFSAAARAQERLAQLGWYLTKEPPAPQRRVRRKGGVA